MFKFKKKKRIQILQPTQPQKEKKFTAMQGVISLVRIPLNSHDIVVISV